MNDLIFSIVVDPKTQERSVEFGAVGEKKSTMSMVAAVQMADVFALTGDQKYADALLSVIDPEFMAQHNSTYTPK